MPKFVATLGLSLVLGTGVASASLLEVGSNVGSSIPQLDPQSGGMACMALAFVVSIVTSQRRQKRLWS